MRYRVSTVIVSLLVFGGISAAGYQEHQHPTGAAGAHRHPEAAKLTNPVKVDPASVAAGKQVFEKNCASCHGHTGKGDGLMGEELDPKPSDLTTGNWKHGSSDGEIFTVMKDGVKGTGMKSFNSKLTARQMWDVVNYVRSLGTAAKSH